HNSTPLKERPREPPARTETACAEPYLLQAAASANLASLEGITVRVYHGIGDCAAQSNGIRRFALDHAAQHGQLGAQHISLDRGCQRRARAGLDARCAILQQD